MPVPRLERLAASGLTLGLPGILLPTEELPSGPLKGKLFLFFHPARYRLIMNTETLHYIHTPFTYTLTTLAPALRFQCLTDRWPILF